MKNANTLLVAALAALSLAAGDGLPPSEIRVAAIQRPNGTSPLLWDHEPSRAPISWTHDTLFEFDSSQPLPVVVPLLAAEPITWNSAGTRAIIQIRSGIRFNGSSRTLMAQDFIDSWKRLDKLPADSIPRRLFAENLQAVSSKDNLTLEVALKQPDPDFEMKLALGFTAPSIEPKEDGQGVGTGPWALEGWHPGKSLRLRAVAGYSNSFSPTDSAALPRCDWLEQAWFEDADQALLAFLEGRLEVLDIPGTIASKVLAAPPKPQLKPELSARQIRLEASLAPEFTFGLLNLRTLKDRKLRSSLVSALDREFWTQAFGAGRELMGTSVLPALEDWGIRQKPEPTRILRFRGSHKTLRVDWVVASPQFAAPSVGVKALVERLDSAGLSAVIEPHPLKAAILRFNAGESDLMILSWSWNIPSLRELVSPILELEPSNAPEVLAIRKAAAQASPSNPKALVKALEQAGVWSAGPRQRRLTLLQPWVREYRASTHAAHPEKNLGTDRRLRKTLGTR